jgi:hypothetical protein
VIAVGRRHHAVGALIAALAAALVLVAPPRALAQAGGRIEGQLVNGTAGASPPGALPVTVHIFKDRSRVGERTVQTDPSGHFVLDGLEAAAGYVYFPIVEYGGASYFPDRPVALDGADSKSVEIRVFEPTQTPDAIAFDRTNLLVLNTSPTALLVMEMGAVVNRSDRTYVGAAGEDGRPTTLRFSLPRGATQVAPQAGLPPDDLVPTPDGFQTANPVVPGRQELAFSYQLPYSSSTLDLAKRLEYPTGTFNLYLPDTGLTAVSPHLTYQGTSELGGQRYQLYSAQGLPAGAAIAIRLGGLPAPDIPRPQQLGLIVLGASAALLGGATAVAIRRRRRANAALAPAHAPVASGGDLERVDLVRSLAELDERYSAGAIDEATYRAEREQGKARLVALLRASQPAR